MSDVNVVFPEGQKRPFSPIAVYYVIISLMMVCLTYIILQLAQRGFPGWNGNYLLPLSFCITLLALTSQRMARDYNLLSGDWFLHIGSEWIVILVFLKALLYLIRDPAQLFMDIPLWQKAFFSTFFTLEYVLVIGLCLVLWIIASFFVEKITQLENSPDLLEQERQGYLNLNRNQVRVNILSMIFALGGVMLIFATLSNVDISILPKPTSSIRAIVAVLIIYFFLGLTILSQCQYSVLNAHWFIESIPTNPKISHYWLTASLVLLSVIALVVVFLPTRYSIGFLALLQSLLGILIVIFTFLQVLILTPIIAFLALLARLLGQGQGKPETTQVVQPTPPPPTPPASSPPIPWLEVVKSILFWLIFVGVIFFAMRYYFSQHKGVWAFLKRFGVFDKVSQIWKWILSSLHKLNQGVVNLVSTGIEKIKALRPKRLTVVNPFRIISRNLPARQRILLTYVMMLRWNSQYGIRRRKSQTPYEYAQMLYPLTPAIRSDLDAITGSFLEARYTRHNISRDQANNVQAAWENMQNTLKAFFQQESQSQE